MQWLPLLMPRPELFRAADLPDLGHRNRPEILEFTAGRSADPDARLWELEDGVMASRSLARNLNDERQLENAALDDNIRLAVMSLPIFTWVYLFESGYAQDDLHSYGSYQAAHLRVFASRSFLTWTFRTTQAPVYRLDRMKWGRHVPSPDFSGLPSSCPVQIVLPFDRSWGSAHQRIELAGHLEEDLGLLSRMLGWALPVQPRRIAMPTVMA